MVWRKCFPDDAWPAHSRDYLGSHLLERDLAPQGLGSERHGAPQGGSFYGEAKSASGGDGAFQGVFFCIVTTIRRSHGDGFPADDFVRPERESPGLFRILNDVVERVFIPTRAFSHDADGVSAPVADQHSLAPVRFCRRPGILMGGGCDRTDDKDDK